MSIPAGSNIGSGSSGVGSGSSGVGSGGSGVGSNGGGVRFSGANFVSDVATPTAVPRAIPDPNIRRIDNDSLHPLMRESIAYVVTRIEEEGLPFRMYETFRSPQRQAWLYGQGRTRNGRRVTNAKPWQSYHQYGLAADFVLWVSGGWSWSTAGIFRRHWKRLHELGSQAGLEKLNWEMPHLQLAGLQLRNLQAGKFPRGGDDLWRDNLEAAAVSWDRQPAAPEIHSRRPEIVLSRRGS